MKNHMDEFKIERALAMSNYGVPVHEISFDLNDVVMDAATTQRPHPGRASGSRSCRATPR